MLYFNVVSRFRLFRLVSPRLGSSSETSAFTLLHAMNVPIHKRKTEWQKNCHSVANSYF